MTIGAKRSISSFCLSNDQGAERGVDGQDGAKGEKRDRGEAGWLQLPRVPVGLTFVGNKTAVTVGVGTATVQRVRAEMGSFESGAAGRSGKTETRAVARQTIGRPDRGAETSKAGATK